ncbi:MAG: hypothetical protein MJ072_04740, partial [Clostridia bacterium]|nr:hypothetical protein [Clostridia bacterium]
MNKKLKVIFGVLLLGVAVFSFSACTKLNPIEQHRKDGYDVSVTYDANGGKFLDRQNVSITDMFKSEDYTDDTGACNIKLTSPTDLSRPSSAGHITIQKAGYSLAGWYLNCSPRLVDEKPVDERGRFVEEKEGVWYVADTKTVSEPAYDYSDPWDFENDKFTVTDDNKEMTLYAGWVPYYEFEYYYSTDDGATWSETAFSTTKFDFVMANAVGSTSADRGTIWVPRWNDGAMNHTFTYSNGTKYNFPKVSGCTFLHAYTDNGCQNEITDNFVHQGSLDYENAKAINFVQKIFVTYETVERYKIESADQICSHPNLNGYYEIVEDLDFTGLSWPQAFVTGEFTGTFVGVGGEKKFSNVSAYYNAS